MSIYKKVMEIFHNTDLSLKDSWLIVKQQNGGCTLSPYKKKCRNKRVFEFYLE